METQNDSEPLFPVDIHIDDIREAIKGRTDFRETQFNDYSTFVYFLGMAKDIFPDPETALDQRTKLLYKLRRECRGIVFSLETGRVIGRRLHKFFNVNETEETKMDLINLNRPYVVTEKLDGSMISPFFTEGVLRFGTKNGANTDTAKAAEDYISLVSDQIDYVTFCTEWINKGWSPIFEFCNSKKKIVLQYEQDSMSLITMRNIRTGLYFPYTEMVELARSKNIPVVKSWTSEEIGIQSSDSQHNQSFEDFYNKIRQTTGVEGFVIRFDDGNMLKIKTIWYFGVSKSLNLVCSNAGERYKWQCIVNEQYDDLRPHMNVEERESMDHFAKRLLEEIKACAVRLLTFVRQSGNTTISPNQFSLVDRKTFASIVNSAPRVERGLLWKIWTDLDNQQSQNAKDQKKEEESLDHEANLLSLIEEWITQQVKDSLGSGQKLQEAKQLLNNVSYINTASGSSQPDSNCDSE